jgi:NADPH:quinone reductase-like Zn-dependent oxidoreductase
MKAWRYTTASGGLENNLRAIFDANLPLHDQLSSTQIIVRVHAASLNPVDYKMPEMPLVGSRMVKLPATPGKDFAGIVARVGASNSTGLKEGQKVLGRLAGSPQYGALGEYVSVNVGEDACIPLPEGVSCESGAAVGTAGMAALQSIKPYLPTGGAVFINGGAAGTGTWGLQIAKALGAKIIVTTCSTASIDFCTSLGATECIDYRTTDVIEALKKKGPIFDVAVDFIGTPTSLYKNSHHFLKPEGQFIQIAATPDAAGILSLLSAQYQPSLLGGGKRKYAFLRSTNVQEDFELVAKWLQDRTVKAVIDSTYKWEDAVEAYKMLKSGRAKGKIIVKGVTAE